MVRQEPLQQFYHFTKCLSRLMRKIGSICFQKVGTLLKDITATSVAIMNDSSVINNVDNLIEDLKHGNIQGSYQLAKKTVDVLLHLISTTKTSSVKELISFIREQGQRLMSAQPSETVVGNMVCRVLKIIRDECRLETAEQQPQQYTQKSLTASTDDVSNKDILSLKKLLLAEGEVEISNKNISPLKAPVIDAIKELLVELDTSQINITAQALEHIHHNEVIMTAGRSRTVEEFFQKAARKKDRAFKVIVVECAPFYQGQKMATRLASAGIDTTLITDSAVFAMMARVNKVIIGTHTVMANGGLKAFIGCHAIALAAKYHSVPLIVCAPLYKLSPKYLCSYDQVAFNKFASPEDVLSFSEGEIVSKAQIYNPIFDYVPPELVTLYIFNIGGNAPSYVYRLLSELYDTEDQDL